MADSDSARRALAAIKHNQESTAIEAPVVEITPFSFDDSEALKQAGIDEKVKVATPTDDSTVVSNATIDDATKTTQGDTLAKDATTVATKTGEALDPQAQSSIFQLDDSQQVVPPKDATVAAPVVVTEPLKTTEPVATIPATTSTVEAPLQLDPDKKYKLPDGSIRTGKEIDGERMLKATFSRKDAELANERKFLKIASENPILATAIQAINSGAKPEDAIKAGLQAGGQGALLQPVKEATVVVDPRSIWPPTDIAEGLTPEGKSLEMEKRFAAHIAYNAEQAMEAKFGAKITELTDQLAKRDSEAAAKAAAEQAYTTEIKETQSYNRKVVETAATLAGVDLTTILPNDRHEVFTKLLEAAQASGIDTSEEYLAANKLPEITSQLLALRAFPLGYKAANVAARVDDAPVFPARVLTPPLQGDAPRGTSVVASPSAGAYRPHAGEEAYAKLRGMKSLQ